MFKALYHMESKIDNRKEEMPVVTKRSKTNNIEDYLTEDLFVKINLEHPNLVKCFGCRRNANMVRGAHLVAETLQFVTEYFEKGNVFDFLSGNSKEKTLPFVILRM